MSFVVCQCGAHISDVVWPSPSVYHVVSDRALDTFTNWSSCRVEVPCAEFKKRLVRECHACGRLLLGDRTDPENKTDFVSYVPERAGQTLRALTSRKEAEEAPS